MTLTVGSLFSGVGGIELGLEATGGFETAWQVEIDPYASRVLAKHWPDAARFRDVRDCGAHNLAAVDLICGGFPCQDVSLAGGRRGLEGQRSTLWSEFARIVGEIRPRWMLAENVPGLLSSDDGRFFGGILRDLAALRYDTEWDCIPAAAFGAPHLRDRLFLVAYPKSGRLEGRRVADGGDTAQGADRTGQPSRSGAGVLSMAHAHMQRRQEQRRAIPTTQGHGASECSDWWAIEPRLGRVADGVSARVDRLKCLGNAVVPQVAEWIGRRILDAEASS